MPDLDEELIGMCRTEKFDLAATGFIASGIRNRDELESYLVKFGELVAIIGSDEKVNNAKTDVDKAEAVFNWLWVSKPNRYNSAPRLTEALDNQLSDSEEVGDCMGLTLLYNSVCQRLGIDMNAVWTIRHIYSAMDVGEEINPIENTSRDGFGNGSGIGKVIGNQQFIQRFLIRLAYDYKEAERYKDAFSLDEIALRINPKTADANSLFELAQKIGDLNMAIASYQRILAEYSDSYEVMVELAQSLEKRNNCGDLVTAIFLYENALKLGKQSDHSLAFSHSCLSRLYMKIKDFKAASVSLQKALELEPDNAYYWQLRGDSFKKQKMYPEAIIHYRKSLKLESDNFLAQSDLSEARFGFALQKVVNFINPVYHAQKVIAYFSTNSKS